MILNIVNKHNVVDFELSSVVTLIPHSNTTTSILISMATQSQLQIRSPPPTTKTKPSDWARHWWRLYWRSNFRLFYIFLMADSLNNNNDYFLYIHPNAENILFFIQRACRSFSMCSLHSFTICKHISPIKCVAYWTRLLGLHRESLYSACDMLTLLICLWIARWENIIV